MNEAPPFTTGTERRCLGLTSSFATASCFSRRSSSSERPAGVFFDGVWETKKRWHRGGGGGVWHYHDRGEGKTCGVVVTGLATADKRTLRPQHKSRSASYRKDPALSYGSSSVAATQITPLEKCTHRDRLLTAVSSGKFRVFCFPQHIPGILRPGSRDSALFRVR